MARTVDDGMAVRKSVIVPLDPAEAFRLFTDRMASWWPLATHSVYDADATGIVVEPRVGGRIFETTGDGRTSEWGVISAWEPGARFATSWYPGNDPSAATQLEVTFSPAAGGGTRVDLVHTGWEARGTEAAEMATSYDTGWTYVLGCFVGAA